MYSRLSLTEKATILPMTFHGETVAFVYTQKTIALVDRVFYN